MERFAEILRVATIATGWVCALAVPIVPAWYLAASLGTKWGFWDWTIGVSLMADIVGPWLLYIGMTASLVTLIMIAGRSLISKRLVGGQAAAILALSICSGGLLYKEMNAPPPNADEWPTDITTDGEDPPHFTSGFIARRSLHDTSLLYGSKRDSEGRPLYLAQQDVWPNLGPAILDRPGPEAYRLAYDLARSSGWRIGAASEQAGMFEAGTETRWFGFRDDIVVRVRALSDTQSRVDVRSLARVDIPDEGRNAQRVADYIAQLEQADSGGQGLLHETD